jgi:WD repeat-containing protein 19
MRMGTCLPAGDVQLAIEFLLLAGQVDQAFDLAAAKGQLQTFGQLAAGSIKVGADKLRKALL